MPVDIFWGIPIALFLGWGAVSVIQGERDARRKKRQQRFCPKCHLEFNAQAWQDDLSSPFGMRLVRKRYCANGHSWVVGWASTTGGESVMDRLGGWQP